MLKRRFASFRETELGGLARDSFHVGIWQATVSIADFVQLALITHLLGVAALGRLALAMSFVVLVGQFFDVRVATAATRFGAERLVNRDVDGLVGVFRLSYLVDTTAGILSFIIVAALAPFVGPRLVGDDGTVLILLYAGTLLISTVDDTSAAVLRLVDRFRLLALCGSSVEAVRIIAVAAALLIHPSLTAVLLALITYDLLGACVNFVVATSTFQRLFARRIGLPRFAALKENRAMLHMVMQTNVVSYARIAQVQLPTVLLGTITTATQVGYYKVGTSAAAVVGRIADPGYAAVLPRLARLWAAGRKEDLVSLLRRTTIIAASLMTAMLGTIVLLRDPILRILGGARGTEAVTVLILVGAAQAINGAVFWNTSLLFAAGRSGLVTAVSLIGMAMQVGLLVPLALRFAADGAAGALLATYATTNLIITVLGIRTLSRLPTEHGSRTAENAVSSPPA